MCISILSAPPPLALTHILSLIILLIYFWLSRQCCVGFSLVATVRTTLHCSVRAFHCRGFSCFGAQALDEQASVVAAPRLRPQAQQLWCMDLLPQGMWLLPGPRIEPTSPASAGGFFTAEPQGKPLDHIPLCTFSLCCAQSCPTLS